MHHIAFHRLAPRHTNHIASHDKTSNHIELVAHIALGYKTGQTKQHSRQCPSYLEVELRNLAGTYFTFLLCSEGQNRSKHAV